MGVRALGRPRPVARLFVVVAFAAALVLSARAAPPGPAAAAEVSREVYQGWKWFHVYCYRCHGTDAIGNPGLPGPDLRASIKSLPKEEFQKTVHDGRLPKGMPAWGQLLTEKQIGELYAYVDARSEGTLKPGRPDEQ